MGLDVFVASPVFTQAMASSGLRCGSLAVASPPWARIVIQVHCAVRGDQD